MKIDNTYERFVKSDRWLLERFNKFVRDERRFAAIYHTTYVYKLAEVAKMLNVSYATAFKRLKRLGVKKLGWQWRITATQIEKMRQT